MNWNGGTEMLYPVGNTPRIPSFTESGAQSILLRRGFVQIKRDDCKMQI